MNIQDLRIGNLINQNNTLTWVYHLDIGGKTFCKINDITIHKKTFIHRDSNELIFSPIPLTEEWLVKFGFDKQENNWKKLTICNDWTNIFWESLAGIEISVNKHSIMLPHINYVHQLQNLYFTLTNEELTLKP